jgi:hypothetical protein
MFPISNVRKNLKDLQETLLIREQQRRETIGEVVVEAIEERLRTAFEDDLENRVINEIDDPRDEREEKLAEEIDERLRQEFEDGLEEAIEAELDKIIESA